MAMLASRPPLTARRAGSLRTERLVLRPFRDDDLYVLRHLLACREVREAALSPIDAETWIQRGRNGPPIGHHDFAITLAGQEDIPVGAVSATAFDDGVPRASIDCFLHPSWWRQGLAAEAAARAVLFALGDGRIRSLRAGCFADNRRGLALLDRLGFEGATDPDAPRLASPATRSPATWHRLERRALRRHLEDPWYRAALPAATTP